MDPVTIFGLINSAIVISIIMKLKEREEQKAISPEALLAVAKKRFERWH